MLLICIRQTPGKYKGEVKTCYKFCYRHPPPTFKTDYNTETAPIKYAFMDGSGNSLPIK